MARRSTRLTSGRYYNSDEESDSSTVTNISYRENSVKVFKKKGGNRKGFVSPSSKSRSNARPATPEAAGTEQHDGLSPSSFDSQTESTMRTVAFISTSPTPRPALTTSSSRGNTPTRLFSEHLQKRPYNGRLSSCSRSEPKEVSQSAVDSSGYSSSEGFYRKTIASVGDAVRAAGVGHRSAISQAFYSLTNSVSAAASATRSKICHVTASANASLSGRMKKACALFVLLLLLLLSVWWLLPFFASFFSAMTTTKIQPRSTTEAQPAAPAVPLPPPPNVISSSAAPVGLDPDAVSAAVDAKMDRLLADMQLKQEHLLAEIKRRLQLDIQDMKAQLKEVNSESRLNLKREVSALDEQISDYHVESQSAAASLNSKIERLESENAKLHEELSSIKLTPPPVPAPVPHLTPELEQAMENWLSARVQEHEATQPSQDTDSARPWADRMADFTLESQGGSVISTRCSETYRSQSACVTLFGFPLWYPSESPRTVIQGHPVLLPGKCWAFHGVQGTLVIALSHPVSITHVTLDHLPRYNAPTGRIDSAPKDFEVYGMTNENEAGTLLGSFTYDQDGEPTQTFELPSPSAVHHLVELRVLTNWGQVEYTCLYRFRVHGKVAERRSNIS